MDNKINLAGIYCLHNLVNDKVYVGRSGDIPRRIIEHRSQSKNSKYTIHLYNAVHKYGWHCFEISVLEELEDYSFAPERETFWMDRLHSTDPDIGYNVKNNGGAIFKREMSQLSREKVSNGLRAFYATDKGKEIHKQSIAKRYSRPGAHEETSKIQKRRWEGGEEREKARRAMKRRWAENGDAMREALKRRRPNSPESNAKIAAALRGRKCSPEAIEKTRKAHIGSKRSEETRAKLREAHLKRAKLVAKIDPIMNSVVEIYQSPITASRATGFHPKSMIAVLHGKRPSLGGFRWQYVESESDKVPLPDSS